tara:strand:- start:96 stop:815 length:720 start_codon:yes stop_codon:yes gene_type:complete
MNIYVSTSNKYLSCIKPFMYLFNKFWFEKTQVTFLGYDEPEFKLPKNCRFISMGKDEGPQTWSNGLRKFFTELDEEFFIFTIEDCFILSEINMDAYNALIKKLDSSVGRISLSGQLINKSHKKIDKFDDFSIIEASKHIEYRKGTQWSVWNKNFMLKYLKDDMSPWQFELSSDDDEYRILGTDGRVPFYFGDAIKARGKKINPKNVEYNLNAIVWGTNSKTEISILESEDKNKILELRS